MIDVAPEVILLEQAKAVLVAIDFEEETGLANVKVRHFRNRHARQTERPCISILFDQTTPFDNAQDSAWEQGHIMEFSLVADVDLPPEDSEVDPTGLETPARLLAACVQRLRAEDSPMRAWCDWISDTGKTPDDDSSSDAARLSHGLQARYRTDANDPNKLLAQGVTP